MGYKPNRKDLDYLIQLFQEGIIKPVIDTCYPLSMTTDAFHYFGTGQVKGKIIITVDSDDQNKRS